MSFPYGYPHFSNVRIFIIQNLYPEVPLSYLLSVTATGAIITNGRGWLNHPLQPFTALYHPLPPFIIVVKQGLSKVKRLIYGQDQYQSREERKL